MLKQYSVSNGRRHHHAFLLILVMRPDRQAFEDIMEIAQEVTRVSPEIVVHIAAPGTTSADIEDWKWSLPTLTVGLGRLMAFIPRRGPILQNMAIKKLDQYHRFRDAGIASPRTERFKFGQRYLEHEFGQFVVLKPLPLSLTSSQQGIMLCETARLHEISPAAFVSAHFLRRAPALVQSFVNTGRKPEYFRVLTLLGEPILWMRIKSAVEQVDLDKSAPPDIEQAVVDPRSTFGDATNFADFLEFEVQDDVVELARAAYDAFPRIPLQACDIVREQSSGRLYILEINAGGNTWDFSSRRVADSREKLGGRTGLVSMYDPWTRAAQALIRRTRELAC
jgi:hypothetical protein